MADENDDPQPDDPTETPSAGEGEETDGGTPPSEGADGERLEPGTKAWADLEKKYPGLNEDQLREKVGLSYWDQTRELSRLSKAFREQELENARLKGRLEAATGTTPKADDEPEALPAEVQELDAHISGLQQQDEEQSNEQLELLKQTKEQSGRVAQIEGRIAEVKANDNMSEDTKRLRIETLEVQLEQAKDKAESIRKELRGTVTERKRIQFEMRRLGNERDWFLSLAKERQAKERDDATDREEQLAEAVSHFNALIDDVVKGDNVPKDPDVRANLREVLQNHITVDLWKAGAKGVPVAKLDIHGMLKQHAERYLKSVSKAQRDDFHRESKERTQVQTPTRQTGTGGGKPEARKPAVVSAAGALPPGMARGRRILEGKGW